MICKMLCFGHVAAYFLSKRFYILDTCVIFHEIMFFKELSAFIALYFIQGTLFPSGRFISFMALLFLGKELLFKVFLSAGKRFIIALSLNLSKCKQVLILFILLSMEQCPIFYFKICISYYFNFLMCSA